MWTKHWLAVTVFCLGLAPAPARVERLGVELPWVAVERLTPSDRGLAETAAEETIVEGGRANWRWEQVRGAVVPLADGSNLLLVSIPASSNCGEIDVAAFGPRGRDGRRERLFLACFHDLRLLWRDGVRTPDLVEERSELWDRVFRWDGTGWHLEEIENFKQPAETDSRSRASTGLRPLLVPLLREPIVRDRMVAGFGKDYVTFLKGFDMVDPLVVEEGCVVTSGRAAQARAIASMLAVCRGEVHAGLRGNDDRLTLVSDIDSFDRLPMPMRAFFGGTGEAPSNLTWAR